MKNLLNKFLHLITSLKLSVLITVGTGFVASICMIFLCVNINAEARNKVEEKVVNNMMTALDGQSNIVRLFVEESEKTLKGYASSGELKVLLQNPEDEEAFATAQAYTERYFSTLTDWEGVYLSDWDTKVLAHSNAGAVGMVTRKGDDLIPYRATMTDNEDGFLMVVRLYLLRHNNLFSISVWQFMMKTIIR